MVGVVWCGWCGRMWLLRCDVVVGVWLGVVRYGVVWCDWCGMMLVKFGVAGMMW